MSKLGAAGPRLSRFLLSSLPLRFFEILRDLIFTDPDRAAEAVVGQFLAFEHLVDLEEEGRGRGHP